MQGSRPNREGARTVQTHLLLGGGGGQPTWAIEKNEKYDELRDGRHMRQGKDRELYPNLPIIGRAGQ